MAYDDDASSAAEEDDQVSFDATDAPEETQATKPVDDQVVTDLLQGKYTTDASQQRMRLAAAGYDPDEVKAAVQRRLAQRYE